MDFLRKLFGGGGGSRSSGDPHGLYVYVRPKGCQEVIEVRIDLNNHLTANDDFSGYFANKTARGVKCRNPVELHLEFDQGRRLLNADIVGGEQVTRVDYDAWLASQDASDEAVV